MAATSKPVPRDLLFSLDTPNAIPISAHEAYIKGWFIAPAENLCELIVQWGDQQVPVFTGLARPDVARHYSNNPAFKCCGFVAHLPRAATAISAKLLARSSEWDYVLAEAIAVPATEARPLSNPSAALSVPPLLSFLIPVDSGPVYPLARTIESIRRQTDSRWQICLLGQSRDSFSSLPDSLRSEPRIAFAHDAAHAEGEFVVSMNAGDELEPSALANYLNELTDGADVVYVDECEIDLYGTHGLVWKKPDFDPEAFSTWNFIGNGAARRHTLLSADLPATVQTIPPDRFRHIPKVLYYARLVDESETARKISGHNAEAGLFPDSSRRRAPIPGGTTIAVILRPEDGVFQKTVLGPVLDSKSTHIYDQRPAELIDEDVALFINGPLEKLNHTFVEELAGLALRPDVGLVTGIALDRTGRILHGGLRRNEQGSLSDPFASLPFASADLPRELAVVRSVDAIVPYFFALRREHLSTLPTSSPIAALNGLRILVTPYAVASFDMISDEAMLQDEAPNDAETLQQISSERNYLRRELASARETLARLEAARCTDWKARVEDLENEVKKRERLQAELLNSLSWKLTRPLRACLRLVRGK